MAETTDVLVVGGGVVGSAAAYFAARRGMSCVLLDRGRVGGGASNAASGLLSPSPGDGPYARLGRRSLELFKELAPVLMEESGVDIELVECGELILALDEGDLIQLQGLGGQVGALGGEARWLDADETLEMEPDLNPAIAGALFMSEPCRVNNQRIAEALSRAASRRGAEIRQGVEVAGLLIEDGKAVGARTADGVVRADSVVLAGGAWTGAMDRWLYGPRAPSVESDAMVRPVKGVNLNVQPSAGGLTRAIHGSWGLLVPRSDGSMIVGATVEEVGFDARVTLGDVHSILGMGSALMPSLRNATLNWAVAGLRPGSADEMPVIGRMPGHANVIAASGHFRNGILLSLATGEAVADLLDGSDGERVSAFDPARFFPPDYDGEAPGGSSLYGDGLWMRD